MDVRIIAVHYNSTTATAVAIENIFLALSSSTGRQLLVILHGEYDPPFISRERRIRLYFTRLSHARILQYHKSLVLEARSIER